MNHRRLVAPVILLVAMGCGALASSLWDDELADRLTPIDVPVDRRIVVVAFDQRRDEDPTDNGAAIAPHRSGRHLKELAIELNDDGARAMVIVGYDSLSLTEGAIDQSQLAVSEDVKRLAVIPLLETSLLLVPDQLPVAVQYRVDSLSSRFAGIGVPIVDGRGTLRAVPMLARVKPPLADGTYVNVPRAGQQAFSRAATTVLPGLVLSGLLGPVGGDSLTEPRPDGFRLGDRKVPLEEGTLRIRWSAGLDGADDRSVINDRDLGPDRPHELFEGAVVLVGSTDPTQTTFVDTPVGPLPEVLVQANALNTMLTGRFVRTLPASYGWAAALVAGLVILTLSRVRSWAGVVAAVIAVAAWLLVGVVLADRGYRLPVAAVAVTAIVVLVGLAAERQIVALAQRRRLTQLFTQYVPDGVARDLIESGQADAARSGQRLLVTALFCDLRGFTSVAGLLLPTQVRELLDIYYDSLSTVVFDHGGTVLKYTGDEIFAVFGAPVPRPDHADAAVECAKAMFDAQSDLNQTLIAGSLPPINYGIGLHSGDVVAAHVGSRIRRQYDIIGDTVNIASRYCTAAREGQIALSDVVVASCTRLDRPADRRTVQIKGVAEPVVAYIIQAGPRETSGDARLPPLGDSDPVRAVYGRK